MKKKGWLTWIAAAVMAVGLFTLSAWAATSWKQEEGKWFYYDSNGSRVTNEWKKGNDNQWRYLNGSGEMAVNAWVDNQYYVDSNGILVTDKWVKLQGYGYDAEYKWYYFGSTGKAVMDTWKKIDNKWYYFDGDGEMQTGWVLDNMYYCGSDGVMRTGWQKLTPPDEDYEEVRVTPDSENDDGKLWYFFGSNGKKYVPDMDGGDYATKKVDGVYYCFDSNGAMQTGWCNVGDDDAEYEIENYRFFDPNGKVRTGWYSAEPPRDIDGYEDDVEWFYFSGNGTPKAGPREGNASTYDLVKINGLTFLFNDLGNPVYGLQKLKIGNSDNVYTAYYFGDKEASSVQRGRQKVEEGDGTITDFYFSESGRGYTGVKDGALYYMGKIQKADEGGKYAVYSIPTGSGHTNYVVNTSGKVAKSKTVKDADGVSYKTGNNGVLLKVNGEEPSGTFNEPWEPVWSYRQ